MYQQLAALFLMIWLARFLSNRAVSDEPVSVAGEEIFTALSKNSLVIST